MNRKQLLVASVLTLVYFFGSTLAFADSKAEIDANVSKTMEQFYTLNPKNKELAGKSAGMLVFPKIRKAGVGIAGEYGEGVLLANFTDNVPCCIAVFLFFKQDFPYNSPCLIPNGCKPVSLDGGRG